MPKLIHKNIFGFSIVIIIAKPKVFFFRILNHSFTLANNYFLFIPFIYEFENLIEYKNDELCNNSYFLLGNI